MHAMPVTHLDILDCGPAITIQDAGRFGAQRYGVSASGPMDLRAFRLANALIGADAGAAVLEFGLYGGRFAADEDILVAIAGGLCPIDVDGRRISPYSGFVLPAGGILTVGALQNGVYGYIALAGGIGTPPFLGSRSTHIVSAIGGHCGRPLRAGDRVPLLPAAGGQRPWRLKPPAPPDHGRPEQALQEQALQEHTMIRIVPGPQANGFTPAAWRSLLRGTFVVTDQRNRMAMTLAGPHLQHTDDHNIISDATTFGSIQVPGTGQPIILLADRQTTGGYPKIATVASCDLGRLAQSRTGDGVRFQEIDVTAAERHAAGARRGLAAKIAGLELAVDGAVLSGERLSAANLISGVTSAFSD